MFRDFSDASKQKLLGLVAEVESEKLCDFTDWIGDRWYDFQSWIGQLNIKNYIDNINTYHKKVIDKNNATRNSIEIIFRDVYNVNTTYNGIFLHIGSVLDKWNTYIDGMCEIVQPSNGKFNSTAMSGKLDNIWKEIRSDSVKCLKNQMVRDIGGELVFDEELIYEYMKKEKAELSIEEQKMLIDVISKLKETVAVYETAASFGTDELGADVLHYVNWASEDTKYSSFAAAGAHYNEIYVRLLNFISEQDKDKATFAASLVQAGSKENTLTLLGAEYSKKLDSVFGGVSFDIYAAKYISEHTEQYFRKLELSEKQKLNVSYDSKKLSDLKDSVNKKLQNSGKYEKIDRKPEYRDIDGNTVRGDDIPEFYKKKHNVAELEKTVDASVSIYDGTFDIGDNGSANVVIGNAEAHGSIAAGLYVYETGEDGEKIKKFSPGVNAEIGASVTAIDVNWEQQWLGDENFGLNSDVGVTLGKAEAKADAAVQIFGEDGKLNLQAGASASAEAIAAELEGSVGVNILGGEVGVSGSVNFGIGAHADVGYKDGVFKFDLGASVGIGVSFGAEIDVGGMVDTVCDVAESAGKCIKEGWDSLWSWL